MNKQIDQILQQRMDRKDFLKHAALGVVMMTGAASLIKVFQQPSAQSQSTATASRQGMAYGSSAYGGVSKQ